MGSSTDLHLRMETLIPGQNKRPSLAMKFEDCGRYQLVGGITENKFGSFELKDNILQEYWLLSVDPCLVEI